VRCGSNICFVVLVGLFLVLVLVLVLIGQNTVLFEEFVQFHHAPPVGRQHIACFITGRFAIYLTFDRAGSNL
jgi:uncharacterized integral membrane protein